MGFEISIPQDVHDKIIHWVNKSDKEVSGFGKVEIDKKTGVFKIIDAFLLEQEVGSAHTDICSKALSKLMFESKDSKGDLRWWWHSHVNMDVFWSAQDRETILDLGKQGWITASVFNKSEEVRSAVCYKYTYSSVFGEGENTQLEDNITTTIILNRDQKEIDSWDKEFTEKVKERKIVTLYDYNEQWGYNPRTGVYSGKPASRATDFASDPGLLGYGIKAESEALGMTSVEYWNKLESKSMSEIYSLEEKLETLAKQDKIRGVPYGAY